MERPFDDNQTRASIFLNMKDSDAAVRELSWEEFHARYKGLILGCARRCGLTDADADEVLQDVLLGFYRVSPQFEYDPTKGKFRGYLKKAVITAAVKLRRRKRATGLGPDDLLADDTSDFEAAWDREWATSVMRRAIDEARNQFLPKTFEAFELYAIRGMAAAEVGQRMDMSENSVHQAKTRVMRVVDSIVRRIREEEG